MRTKIKEKSLTPAGFEPATSGLDHRRSTNGSSRRTNYHVTDYKGQINTLHLGCLWFPVSCFFVSTFIRWHRPLFVRPSLRKQIGIMACLLKHECLGLLLLQILMLSFERKVQAEAGKNDNFVTWYPATEKCTISRFRSRKRPTANV